MQTRVASWHARTISWHNLSLELILAVFLALLIVTPAFAANKRLQDRSIYMNSSAASEQTFYRLSWRYMSSEPVGSVELLFCDDPIPYHPCVKPAGQDVLSASLTQQSGETGFTISQRSANRIVLTRTATSPVNMMSHYRFDDIINPSQSDTAFAIRLKTFSSSDATGPQVDFGSMRAQVTPGIELETQVPPMLIFCLAEQVAEDCSSTNDNHYADMGELRADSTLTAQSQMAVGTNASDGFIITANAAPLSAGTNVIDSLEVPTASRQGVNQFGINLVANSSPAVGNDPEGPWTNAIVSPDYGQPDRYMLQTGDVVASSPNVSLMRKYTVSYIVNSSPDLEAGVYTTTINFIASGRF